MIQFFLAFFGLSSAWMAMVSKNPRANKWAPVVGLIGQPFWMAYALLSDGWGLLVVSAFFTVIYLKAAIQNFFSNF